MLNFIYLMWKFNAWNNANTFLLLKRLVIFFISDKMLWNDIDYFSFKVLIIW